MASLPDYLKFREAFAQAMDPRLFNIQYLDWLVSSGQGLFMQAGQSAIVFTVRQFPTGLRAVDGVVAAGEQSEIEDILIPAAEEWGRDNGCQASLIESRPGWAKRLKNRGYETFQVSIIKDLK